MSGSLSDSILHFYRVCAHQKGVSPFTNESSSATTTASYRPLPQLADVHWTQVFSVTFMVLDAQAALEVFSVTEQHTSCTCINIILSCRAHCNSVSSIICYLFLSVELPQALHHHMEPNGPRSEQCCKPTAPRATMCEWLCMTPYLETDNESILSQFIVLSTGAASKVGSNAKCHRGSTCISAMFMYSKD